MARKKPVPKLSRKKGLYLDDAGVKGRGVFCSAPIRKGEFLETTPCIILNEDATRKVDKTMMQQYTFMIGKLTKRQRAAAGLKRAEYASAVVMGMLSFCNHDEQPNAEILWEEVRGTLYYFLQATKNIPRNTEICTSYGDTWFKERE